MAKRDPVIRQLSKLIADTIVSLDDADTTPRDIADVALEAAQKIARMRMREMLRRVLIKLAGEQLRAGKHSRAAETTPLLRGLEDLLLPRRIAVPWLGVDPDEDSSACIWRPLHRCSFNDLAANLKMRLQNIAGSQAEHDRLLRVYETGVAAGGQDEDIIGDVLGVVTEDAS